MEMVCTGEVLVIYWDYPDTPIDAFRSGVTGIRHVRYTTETLKENTKRVRKTEFSLAPRQVWV